MYERRLYFFNAHKSSFYLSKIVSIGTALPAYRHRQQDILAFMLDAYQPEAEDRRKITLLYERSGIESRHSVIPDFSLPEEERVFFSSSPARLPSLEQRMALYRLHATDLSIRAIQDCLGQEYSPADITCLITVSCTGMSAPGLDIGIMERLLLSPSIQRSSVNFMGCYAAMHALKMADHICRADENARVMIVCTELCTIHFQRACEMDSITSALLFGDGAAAALVTGNTFPQKGVSIKSFYSEVSLKGKEDMAWDLSGRGFLMHLSAYIPQLLREGIKGLLQKALRAAGSRQEQITRWAIHPGGRKILEMIRKELGLPEEGLHPSFDVLRECGNMSSPTVLFVLKKILSQMNGAPERIFAAAFGPGLTMETLILEQ